MNIDQCMFKKIVYFDYDAIMEIFISWSTSISFISLKFSYKI